MQDGTYRIPVKDGDDILWTIVSAEDYAALLPINWFLNSGYARRNGPGHPYMHRVILGLEHGDTREADHINRDRLDNRRENLRIVTRARNQANVGSQPGSASRFRGVYRNKKRWSGQAALHRKTHCLGTYDTEVEAAAAVNAFWVERGYEAPNDV